MHASQPHPKSTILIVDDAPENLHLLRAILEKEYRIKAAIDGAKAIELACNPQDPPDLILLDVMMPGIHGYDVCRALKTNPIARKIPVIFVTALNDISDESQAFDVGAVDFITKPVSAPVVRARVATHLELYHQKRTLESMVQARTEELSHTQDVTIIGFATLAEFRDQETGAHILRTKEYVRILAQQLAQQPQWQALLTPQYINLLYKSAPLHDIGKIAIPDQILLKPGKLTPEEFEIMKKHTLYGRDAIARAEQALGNVQNSFLSLAKEIAYTHHEKWDGSGYPQGLHGEQIPLSGRIMAIADVYDALISKRVYKPAFAVTEAEQIIENERGKHFDPALVDAFLASRQHFWQIALNINDGK
ncbi:MAG: two-component system response regulator [Anaerolineales bacterium]